jgi:hypothetical protein
MTAARYDLTIDQGSDFSLELTVKESGSLKNLSGWHGRASMRKTLEDDVIKSFTVSTHVGTDSTDSGTYGIQPSDKLGKVTLSMAYSSTDDVTAGTYHYDLEIYYNNSGDSTVGATQVKRLIGGMATVRREITR